MIIKGSSALDHSFMQAALDEARGAAANNEVPVGAVVVQNSEIIGRGGNRPIRSCDPTAHAEAIAIRDAAARIENYRLPGASIYVTLEPCAMCMGLLLNARISRLIFAAYDEKSGAAGSVVDLPRSLRAGKRIEINGGLMADESAMLLRTFFEQRR